MRARPGRELRRTRNAHQASNQSLDTPSTDLAGLIDFVRGVVNSARAGGATSQAQQLPQQQELDMSIVRREGYNDDVLTGERFHHAVERGFVSACPSPG